MTTQTLDGYDFESVTNYMKEFTAHVANESNANLGLISIIVDKDTKSIDVFSNMNNAVLFKYLILSAMKVMPEIKSKFKREDEIRDIVNQLMSG